MTVTEAFELAIKLHPSKVIDKSNSRCIRKFWLEQHPACSGDFILTEMRSNHDGTIHHYGFSIPMSQLPSKRTEQAA